MTDITQVLAHFERGDVSASSELLPLVYDELVPSEHGEPRDGKKLPTPLHFGRLCSELKGDLDWITMKAIANDRNQRYASVADLAADIRRHVNHEPVQAGPVAPLYRLKKLLRRRKSRVAVLS